jgi:hypothetical protein
MAFTLKNNSLTALSPLNLSYKYNSNSDSLAGKTKTFDNGLSVCEYVALSSCKDVALSNQNCLLLTDLISVNRAIIASKPPKSLLGNKIYNNGLLLRKSTGEYLKIYKDNFYFGGIGNVAYMNLIVIEDNIVEITIDKTKFLQVSQVYPFDVFASEEEIDSERIFTKRFHVEYYQGLIYLKCKTPDGYRFLSCGVDKKLRAVGCSLNATEINPYLFVPEFVSETTNESEEFNYLKTFEVIYTNELNGKNEHENLTIKSKQENDTNLLISFATEEALNQKEVSTNLSILKNNFTAEGTYSTK